MEQILAVVGGLTALVAALTLLLKGLNYFIRESSLVANSVLEIMKYGWKRRKKNGHVPLSD